MTVRELRQKLFEVEDQEATIDITVNINGIDVYLPIKEIGFTGQIKTELKSI